MTRALFSPFMNTSHLSKWNICGSDVHYFQGWFRKFNYMFLLALSSREHIKVLNP